MKKHEKKEKQIDVVEEVICSFASKNDPNGSWTGRPLDEGELPVQDADDL
ncbi:MAG: hypothetical protein IIV87_03810 [Oscillospiraceae bacterium]|nr:hypothetical protein [Oscillospiraceae bacterium]MBQ5749262.1 hypothetical protein [Oscillospiraceae bacterium]